jgi:hypothetical protein
LHDPLGGRSYLTQDPLRVPVVPVPDNATVCGLPAALSVTESAPVRLPVAPGVKVTLIKQLAPGTRGEVQVLVSSKLALASMLVMLSGAVPELLNMMDCALLVSPSSSLLKVKLTVENATLGDGDPPPQPLTKNEPQSVSQRCFFTIPLPTEAGA